MQRRDIARLAATVGIGLVAAAPGSVRAQADAEHASLDALLRPYLAAHGLPAVAAAVTRGGAIVAAGAVGTRRAGTDTPVTINDRFHLGSDTKAMTATLLAMQVEAGRLRWDSTPLEVFPDLADTMDAGVKGITLEQILSHTSGIPSDSEADVQLLEHSIGLDDQNLDEMRRWIIERVTARQLQSKPGVKFAYANMGYILAGAMLERLTGRTWEELVIERLFTPLGLTTAGLGPQSSRGRVDAPLGHWTRPDGTLKPLLAGPAGDNPAVLGPAGTAHMSVLDFAIWAAWNAGEGRRPPALLRPETVRRLHTKVIDLPPRPDAQPGTPKAGGYGLGWGTVTMPFAPEPFLFHAGSNQLNLAYIIVRPKDDYAMVLLTNVSNQKVDLALLKIAADLYAAFPPAAPT